MFTCAGIVPPLCMTLSKDEGIEKIIEKINESLANKTPLVVFIAGGSSSGKTRIADILYKKFEKDAVLISQDNYYIGREFSELNKFNFDQPESIELKRLNEDILLLSEGKSIRQPIYSFIEDGGKRIGYKTINPAPIIIVEGLFVLNKEFPIRNELKVFIKSDCHTRFIRRIVRDSSRACWSAEEILNYFLRIVEPMHSKYIDKQEFLADLIILNQYDLDVEPSNCCLKEEQIKVRISHPLSSKELASAEKISCTNQRDIYFSSPGKTEEEILRIREEGGSILFTYKAPREKGSEARVKRKLEIPISLEEIDLAFKSWDKKLEITKCRHIFVLNDLVFSQDCISLSGGNEEHFLEIRSSDPEKIKELLTKLGLEGSEIIKESYFDIFK